MSVSTVTSSDDSPSVDDVAAASGMAACGDSAAADRIIRIAVTTLADFACRCGDLDSGGVVGPTARDGQQAHQRVQAASEGATEVRLQRRIQLDGSWLELSGRVDLLDRERGAIGEIKSTLVPSSRLPETRQALHRAQLYLYGWLWLGQEDVDAVEVILERVYVNLRNGATETLAETLGQGALDAHAEYALGAWLSWQRLLDERQRTLQETARAIPFPHADFRDGQRRMAVATYRCLRDGGALLVEAPTGIGKTISSLYPAVKALGERRCRQIYYLTAKVSGRQSATDALQRLTSGGLAVSALTLRSRESSCFCERGRCERDEQARCPMTLGFHDRLPAARIELISMGVVTPQELDEIAWDHQLCPHALARELVPWLDIIIGDFNHVFDPLSRLSQPEALVRQSALLIDEAHNLLPRSRAMFSASLSRRDCDAAERACSVALPLISRQIATLSRALLDVGKGRQTGESVAAEIMPPVLRRAAKLLELLLDTSGDGVVLPGEASSLLQRLTRFITVAALADDEHRVVVAVDTEQHSRAVELRLVCLDAAKLLSRQRSRFFASIVFSATLAPLDFYRERLGLPDDAFALTLPSPFPPERALHCVVPWIDTRFRKRDASLVALVSLIAQVSDAKPGNYLVCLPSFAYLEKVFDAYRLERPEQILWRQQPGGVSQRTATHPSDAPIAEASIGFVILGGVHAEGIDYKGDALIGVIIVGTALPPPGLVQELMVERLGVRGNSGFDLAVRCPGFVRVLQTAGRVIRGEADRGVVILVDDRLDGSFYRRLYPAHWNVRRTRSPEALDSIVSAFWSGKLQESDPVNIKVED